MGSGDENGMLSIIQRTRTALLFIVLHLCIGIMDWFKIFLLFALFFTLTTGEEETVTIEVVHKPPEEKCQRKSKDGDLLAMHYTGRLEKDGSVFDSSHNRKQTFDFTLGRGMVIQGWEQGLKDMCVGEKRKLRVPAHLGKFIILFWTSVGTRINDP